MTDEQIQKAFENRWRIKGYDDYEVRQLSGKDVKDLCLDFFRTGILLAEKTDVSAVSPADTQPIIPMSAIMKASEEVAFSTWWDMYGKKIDRAKCQRKWNKLSIADKEACLAATPAYVASTPDLQYRRHPATYLNNRSWENQIITPNNATNTQSSIQQQRLAKLADILAG